MQRYHRGDEVLWRPEALKGRVKGLSVDPIEGLLEIQAKDSPALSRQTDLASPC